MDELDVIIYTTGCLIKSIITKCSGYGLHSEWH